MALKTAAENGVADQPKKDTAGQKKILDVVGSRTFDFFNTREILYLSQIVDLFDSKLWLVRLKPHIQRVFVSETQEFFVSTMVLPLSP